MPDQTPAADDHRGQLRALLVQAGELAAALDEIAQDNPRREADVIRQLRAWRRQLGATLDNLGGTVEDLPTPTTKETAMSNPSIPADHNSAYLDALADQVAKRLGQVIVDTTKAIFTADGFAWRDDVTRTVIAAHFRALPDTGLDTADAITRVICATYTDRGFPHNPDTVWQAVGRHLGDGHEGLPPAPRP